MSEPVDLYPETPVEYATATTEPNLLPLTVQSPYFDAELVQSVISDMPESHADRLARRLNTYIHIGSRSLLQYDTSPREAESIREARLGFYRLSEWTRPTHPMHRWYRNTISRLPYGIKPGNIVQNVRFIQNLYGKGDLQENVLKAASLLGSSPETIIKGYEHLIRLTGVFGWSDSDVRHILRARPAILKNSSETQYFYARAAACHAEKLHLTDDPESLLHGPISYMSPQDLMSHLAGISPSVKRSPQGKDEKISNFLSALNAPPRQHRAGIEVVHAYFRRAPLRNALLLRDWYPNLQRYHPGALRKWNRVTGFIEVDEIISAAPWLETARLPGKDIDVNALNEYARVGSRRLRNKARNFQELRSQTYEARRKFVNELGWTHPDHPLYTLSLKIEDTQQWPSPSNMINVISALSEYTSDPIRCVKSLGLALLSTKQSTLDQKLLVISQAFPGERVLDRWPSLLRSSNLEIMRYGHKAGA